MLNKDIHRHTANRFCAMLTPLQTEILRAAVTCILPADEYPDGWDAGVGAYLTRLLTREPGLLFTYQRGLDALGSEEGGFHRLERPVQNTLLTRLESEPERGAFFRLLIAHTMEGFYADPGNGGNKDGVAWKMIGYGVTG